MQVKWIEVNNWLCKTVSKTDTLHHILGSTCIQTISRENKAWRENKRGRHSECNCQLNSYPVASGKAHFYCLTPQPQSHSSSSFTCPLYVINGKESVGKEVGILLTHPPVNRVHPSLPPSPLLPSESLSTPEARSQAPQSLRDTCGLPFPAIVHNHLALCVGFCWSVSVFVSTQVCVYSPDCLLHLSSHPSLKHLLL